jgi:N-acyl-D-aspartate/D-glutamate deacylase
VSQPYADADVLVIRDTTIVDGTGRPAYTGSVAIRGSKIVAVGQVDVDGARRIDGEGRITCPGFVDPHSHADGSILDYPLAENLVMQGITTFVGGNCGMSQAPTEDPSQPWRTFDEWLSHVEGVGLSPNYAPLVGHNTVRRIALGEKWRREATADEVQAMADMVEEAMRGGAFGLSTGLDAAWPAHFAAVDEIVALAKVARRYGGFFAPHTRHHQSQWPADDPDEYGYGIFHAPAGEVIAGRYHGLLEAVEISRKADQVPLIIAHLTPAYVVPQPHPDFLDDALARATLMDVIDRPRQEGLDVTYNVIAWSQSIASEAPLMASFFNPALALPEWIKDMSPEAGAPEAFAHGLKERAFRDKVRDFVFSGKFKFRMIHPHADPYWMDCIQIVRCQDESYVGKTIGELARQREPDSIP